MYSPFARNDVRKRHALQAGEAAHAPSSSSIDCAKAVSLVDSTLTGPPPLTPPSQGGEKKTRFRPSPRNQTGTIARRCQSPVFTAPG